jgi:hypothetical protein
LAVSGHGLTKNADFKTRARKRVQDFTRDRKMSFAKLIWFLLSMINESSQNALERYFPKIGEAGMQMSQQSFSEARQKIKWEALQELFEQSVALTYSKYTERWYGWRVMAIDGSKIALPSDKKLKAYFGTYGNGENAVTGQASILYDIYNDTVMDALFEPMSTGERELALKHIDKLGRMGDFLKELIIFDRGYPSFELIKTLNEEKISFLMRVKSKFSTAIDEGKGRDFIVQLRNKEGERIPVRVIKFELSGGETEVLITNLFDKHIKQKQLKELYFKRWPVETKYDEVKNKLALENFSGRTVTAVKQDFYAAMYLENLASAFYWEAQDKVKKERRDKDNKYTYHVNVNHEIGVLKDKLVAAVIEKDKAKQDLLWDDIVKTISSRVVPYRPNRSVPRNPPRSQRFYMNQKLNC